jgi:hypothetical protein
MMRGIVKLVDVLTVRGHPVRRDQAGYRCSACGIYWHRDTDMRTIAWCVGVRE